MGRRHGGIVSQSYSIDRLIDDQKFSTFNLVLLVWSFLAMVADGFDISSLASAAPQLARAWHVPPQDFGPAFSASLFGVLFGAPLLGYLGDRFGRRMAIIVGSLIYGCATLATVWATNLDQMVALRFVTGIGIGGLMPNTIALNSELSPKRLRATLIVLMFTGITTGSGLPGYIQAWLIPRYGWPVMFWIGGLAPLVIAVGLWFFLPESVKFLSLRPQRRDELLQLLRRMRPDLTLTTADEFVPTAAAPVSRGTGIAQLFSGSLAFITPLLWVCFAMALMANYFLNSWLPLVLVDSGMTAQQSGITTSLYHYGGTLGGILLSLVLGRYGFTTVALLFLLAILGIAAIGLPGHSAVVVGTAVAIAGFSTLGAQFGNNATSGLLYPTAIRARGVGWALGVGRLGGMLGPLIGGVLVGWKLPPQKLFMLAAAPMLLGLLASIGVARLCYKRFGSLQLEDLPPSSPPK